MNTLVEGPFLHRCVQYFMHWVCIFFFKMHNTASDDAKCSLLGMYPSSCFIGFDRIYCGGLLFRKRCLFSLYNLHDLPERSWGLEKLGVCPPPMFWALKLYPPHRGCLSNNHNDHIRKPGVWPKAQLLQLAYHICTQHYNKAVIPGKAIMT